MSIDTRVSISINVVAYSLLDATGAQFAKGALNGKFAGTFFSTGSQVSDLVWVTDVRDKLTHVVARWPRNNCIDHYSLLCPSRYDLCASRLSSCFV